MRDEDVERVAKAIFGAGTSSDDHEFVNRLWTQADQFKWFQAARAAITAYLNGDGSLMK